MIPPEFSGLATARSEHPNVDESEENYFKNNFMNMIKALKREVKNSFKSRKYKQKNERNY